MAAVVAMAMVVVMMPISTGPVALRLKVSLLLLFLVLFVLVFQRICSNGADNAAEDGTEHSTTKPVADEATSATANQCRTEASLAIWTDCAIWTLPVLWLTLTLRRIGRIV